jgi:hypothetical protein
MPFTGGYNPQPERYGGGDAGSNAPLLQRVVESLATARGQTYAQTLTTAVGVENMAIARAIAYDLYGANVRFANEMNPATATVGGLLPRWEKILAAPPAPGDAQTTRQARCVAKLLRFGYPNHSQAVADAVQVVLGNLFTGMTYIRPDQATTWWPGFGGTAGQVAAISGNQVTVTGLANVPTSAPGKNLVVTGDPYSGNNGTFPVQSWVSASSVVIINNGSPVVDGGGQFFTWTMPNPVSPFTSTIAHVLVLVNPTAVPGYVNADGSLNAKFFQTMNQLNPVLDWLLPADVTYDWYVSNTHTFGIGFYLDDPNNLDTEVFDV